uniref:Uncharacterized protein n=1 Tax=Paracercomonas marina TaxID=372086 RepID=A0A0B5GNL5_9EUKA|nr:hypothetical protein [Paracercomonas marina]AJF22844.1 hypothetical protein [Paracercomonas marina]
MESKTFYVYITFTADNIFVNCYREVEEGTKDPVGFKQLSSGKLLTGRTKRTWESVTVMADKIANWVKSLHQEAVIIVFKNFGLSFKRKGQTEAGIEAKRDAFIEAFTKMNVTISTLIDTSAIPFNGCKTQKVRRKKKKHMIKHPPAIST